MTIIEIKKNKKQYLDFLLLADEQEYMIDRYLDRGTMFALDDNGVKAVCVVTDEGDGVLEIKNLAVTPEHQRKGYGRQMMDHIEQVYKDRLSVLQVGTGESPLTLPFYEKCGFTVSHRIENFFTDNYDHPIIESGVQLCDMICFEKELSDNYGTDREGIAEIR